MRHLFDEAGQAALQALMRSRPLLAFDFDGTLAPIVARPDDARVSQGIAGRLQRLAGLLPLAVVSGLLELDQLTDLLHTLESLCDTVPLPDVDVNARTDSVTVPVPKVDVDVNRGGTDTTRRDTTRRPPPQ